MELSTRLIICPDTPIGQTVNSSGCALSQIDSDGDGVTDDVDQQPDTRSGVPVDSNGVMLNPVYLDSNGVTIKAYDWSIVGDSGEINGKTYTIINREELDQKVESQSDLTNICISKITNLERAFIEKVVLTKTLVLGIHPTLNIWVICFMG